MASEIKRLIQVRTDKGARFKRDGYGKKRQLSDSWRKPRGQHNKQREQKKAKGAHPTPGFGSPVAVRGMHPSGYFEALVSTIKELEGLDPKTQAVRISATVGSRKRAAIQDKAITAGFRVLNAKVIKPKAKAPAKPRKEEAAKKPEKKAPAPKAEKKAPAKKAAAKPKTEKAEAKAEKKAPAKKAAAKPKTEKAEAKAEKKAPAKKAAAKPKTEKAEAKAEKKAPAKKPAAKTTKSGVKKNE